MMTKSTGSVTSTTTAGHAHRETQKPTTATPWIKASPTSQSAPGLPRSTLLPPPSTATGFLRLVLLPSFGNSTPTLNRRSHLNPRGASVQAAQIAEKRPDHQADAHGQQQVQRRQVRVAGDVEGRAPEQRVELGLDGGRHSRGLGVEAVKGRRRRAGRFRRSHLERRGRGKNTSDALTHRGSGRGGFGREGRGGHSGCSGYMGREGRNGRSRGYGLVLSLLPSVHRRNIDGGTIDEQGARGGGGYVHDLNNPPRQTGADLHSAVSPTRPTLPPFAAKARRCR